MDAAATSHIHDVFARGSLTLGGTRVFERIDFAAERGAWTCVLGRSGVGKSALLRVVAGLAEAFEGEAGPGGGVAWMAQSDLLLPWADVYANAALGARLRGDPVDAEKIRAAIEAVGLGDRAAALPAELSGGQRQRAALARTLVEDRPVVLLDEPFSALDAVTRARLQDLALDALRGRTVVHVTHDPLEALRLADRIAVLAPGGGLDWVDPEGATPRPLRDQIAAAEALTAMLEAAG